MAPGTIPDAVTLLRGSGPESDAPPRRIERGGWVLPVRSGVVQLAVVWPQIPDPSPAHCLTCGNAVT